MSLNNIINNLNFDAIPAQYLVNQDGEPIEVRYAGNYTDPENQLSYFVYATNDRTPIFVPQPLAPHQYPVFHAQPYQDDYPADHMESPRPRPQRHRSSRQQSARQRRITRRAERREAMERFRESQMRNMFANPANIFMNQNQVQEPLAQMQRPASPVRQQPPNPQSHRQQRKASRQQRQQQQQQQQSNIIPQSRRNRVVGGGKKSKRRRN
jgi:hypothetical protein